MNDPLFRKPAFVLGVTGHIDPHERAFNESKPEQDLRAKIRLIFRFLKEGAQAHGGELRRQLEASLPDRHLAPGISEWAGLSETPIVVLTSLAPGADSIVAEEAIKMGFQVRAPLPFERELYREASTFVQDRSKPTEAEQADQKRFDCLSGLIGEKNIYPVRLKAEIDVPEAALIARMKVDRDATERTGRHRRYQAAGEYIAAHCDLLLALWDDDDTEGRPEGTGGIVQAKLRGLTPDLLPTANSFTWADCGSVLHLYMPRRKNAAAPNEAKLGKLRWLHTGTLPGEQWQGPDAKKRPSFIQCLQELWHVPIARCTAAGKRWRAYQAWQRLGNHSLCRLAKNLNAFNQNYQPSDPAVPLRKTLNLLAAVPPDRPLAEELEAQNPGAFVALIPLVAARRHAADTSRDTLRPQARLALLGMFFLVFGFAVFLHIFAHWHLPEEKSPATGATAVSAETGPAGGSAISPLAAPGGDEHASLRLRFYFGLASLLFGVCSLVLFWWHRRDEVEERDQDYRAFSEGLRVQFVWCVAGLYRSAAAHYVERQRNELEWIRRALASLSMPHHRWSEWFGSLSEDLQLRLLRWTQTQWVGEQAEYYDKRVKEHSHSLHFWHKLGGVLALGGLLQVAVIVVDAKAHFLAVHAFAHFSRLALKSDALGLLLLLLLLLGLWTYEVWTARRGQPWAATPWRSLAGRKFKPACWALLESVVYTGHASVYQSQRRRRWQMIRSFLAHLLLASLLAVVVTTVATAASTSRHFTAWPDAEGLLTISSGIFLLTGALLVAWAEKNLHSEQAYQYNTMASLFTTAWTHLDGYLNAAEEAKQNQDPAARALQIQRAQLLLYDLGIEALDENAEWLILHRARPMEPMMTG